MDITWLIFYNHFMSVQTKTVSYREILAIALPMVASQASETVMLFVDRLFLSLVDITVMASALSGGLTSFVFQSFFIGLVGYSTALVAQFYGAGQMKSGLQTVSQAFILSFVAYPLTLAVIPLGRLSFILAGHDPLQIGYEYTYFSILMFGSILTFLRTTLGSYFVAIGKTSVVLMANIVGMLVNILFNYILIFGKLGFPALGLRGAAYGTLGGIFIIVLILFRSYLRNSEYHTYRSKKTWHFDKSIFLLLCRFGIPSGGELFLNVMAFNVGLQLLHSYSTQVAAAVTITFNYDALAFIPMLGLGFSTTSIVGRFMGAKNPETAKTAGFKAWQLGLIYASIVTIVFVFAAKPLTNLFASQFKADEAVYLKLAENMLRLAAIYTLADVTQLIFSSALRGAGDTHWVMRTSVLLHWIYAIVAIFFVRILKLPPLTMWLVFIAFIICLGIVMTLRYTRGNWQNISVIGAD